MPPRLAQINFLGGSRAGERAQATCLVLGGDPPVALRWSKDGRDLVRGSEGLSSGVVITAINEFTSLLIIDNPEGKDSGNYTCTATNSASSMASSTMYSVEGKNSSHILQITNIYRTTTPLGLPLSVVFIESSHRCNSMLTN